MPLRAPRLRSTALAALAAIVGLSAFYLFRHAPATPGASGPATRAGSSRPDEPARTRTPACEAAGGTLVAAIRGEPERFNPLVGAPDNTLDLLSHLLHGRLVRIDRESGELEPWLAE